MSDIPQLSSRLQSTSLAPATAPTGTNNLSTLPVDILTHDLTPQFANPPVYLSPAPVLQSTPDSTPLRQLSSTSRHFRDLVRGQYKTYVQHQYPTVFNHAITASKGGDINRINWFSLAVDSEKLSQRWNLRQFYISRVQTQDEATSPKGNNNSHSLRPSAAYSPRLDVAEAIDGTETLVVGQGTSVAIRRGEYAPWQEVKRKGMTAGADDLLSVHIYNADTVISCRSSSVEIISSKGDDGKAKIVQTTELFPSGPKNPTGGITSSCLSSQSFAITTSVTSGDTNSLQFFTLDEGTPSLPKSATLVTDLPSKPYTSAFLTKSTIATGHRAGISLHNLTSSAISTTTPPQPSTIYSHALSVHSLTTISTLSPSIFASGWSDGITRLFDTRSNEYVAEYENPISNEFVPVFSLLHTSPLGNILMAGSSLHHAVEIHDLRYPGNMVGYFSPYMFNPLEGEMRDIVSEGCLLFFDNVVGTPFQPLQRRGRFSGRGSSAIYSLSSPGPASGKVYIGEENTVIQVDFRKRKVGGEWGRGLTGAEKVRKKEAERGAGGGHVPMYWFDPARGKGDGGEENGPHGGVNGRWWCGGGKAAVKVKERGAGRSWWR
ncbi:hypothetical protein TWF481_000056 [Arthrobotrys musiformis]|uniref:F-box domain-containing protein n=1 Tax=Arthrobotrys musiformis TaxID=47236 RepID=A0AAV9WMJ4_9PEZI